MYALQMNGATQRKFNQGTKAGYKKIAIIPLAITTIGYNFSVSLNLIILEINFRGIGLSIGNWMEPFPVL
jgi:hypothetical protein